MLRTGRRSSSFSSSGSSSHGKSALWSRYLLLRLSRKVFAAGIQPACRFSITQRLCSERARSSSLACRRSSKAGSIGTSGICFRNHRLTARSFTAM